MSDHPIKSYRKEFKLTQTELADRLGVKKAAVSKWERGSRRVPRNVMSIATQLGIPVADLLKTPEEGSK